jgi:hypothetical protein
MIQPLPTRYSKKNHLGSQNQEIRKKVAKDISPLLESQ